MRKHVLFVGEAFRIIQKLKRVVTGDSVDIFVVSSIDAAILEIRKSQYHLIVLFPELLRDSDYLNRLHLIRTITLAPVIIAKRHCAPKERVCVRQCGADELITMPISIRQCIRVAEALMNRYNGFKIPHNVPYTVIAHQELILVVEQRAVYINYTETEFARKEFDILLFLMENRGMVLTHYQIYQRVWCDEYEADYRRIVWTHVHKIRSKIKKISHDCLFIKTIHGIGYMLD